jgi:hypothetical protein
VTDLSQWTTAEPLIRGYPTWIGDEMEQRRIAAYQLYESIYWGVPNAFKLMARGEDDNPIYLPAPKTIVETLHRFMANDIRMIPDPEIGTTSDQKNSMTVLTPFLRREGFRSKFNANKREGIFRGDWVWHLYADPLREEGARISIQTADPAGVFPIYNEDNLDEIIGYHIVDQQMFEGKEVIKRTTYRKTTGVGGPSPITVEIAMFKLDKWGGPGMDPDDEEVVSNVQSPFTLPAPIDQLPIYWIPNFQQTGTIFGSSELRGLERILAAMNQGITDEELALALEGLGLYKTNAGTPVDENGIEVPWDLGPGRVLNLPTDDPGVFFDRLNGITSVGPYQDHLSFLSQQIDEAACLPAIAKGKVDVQVAESGISLMLQMGPLLAKAIEKEQIVTDVMIKMFYDLRNWFAAYEPSAISGPLQNVNFIPVYGDKIPPNKSQRFTEIMALFEANVVSGMWVRSELTKIGYEFPDDATMTAQILQEKSAMGSVTADPFGDRMNTELPAEDTTP